MALRKRAVRGNSRFSVSITFCASARLETFRVIVEQGAGAHTEAVSQDGRFCLLIPDLPMVLFDPGELLPAPHPKAPADTQAAIDAFSRRVIGWALDRTVEDDLAARGASVWHWGCGTRRPGCVHHSDRGSRYKSGDYTDLLKAHGCEISMSHKSDPWGKMRAASRG